MTQEKSYIEELFSDAHPLDEKSIVEALKSHLTIQRDNKEIYLKNTAKVVADDKILAYGLAKKLLRSKGFVEQETISANEVHKKTGIKKGTVDSSFKKLREDGLFVGSGKNYEIPNYKVEEIISRLSKGEKKLNNYGDRKRNFKIKK